MLLAPLPDLCFMAEGYYGLRLIGIPDLFEALCWPIIGQQINLTFAHTLKRRLVEAAGIKLTFEAYTYFAFPSAEAVCGLSVAELRGMQYSTKKAEYLLNVAAIFQNNSLSKEYLRDLGSTEEMIKELISIKGIGEWTANYALLKSLGILSCIPYGDAGLKNALIKLYGKQEEITRQYLVDYFKRFNGWEGYLVIYLWRMLSNPV